MHIPSSPRYRLGTALILLSTMVLVSCPGGGRLIDSFVAIGPGDVDMLWILDASGSMADAQGQLSQNFHRFVEGLPETSTTQMALTTTQAWPCKSVLASSDNCDDGVGTAGRIQRVGNSVALLDPSDDLDQETFQQLAHVGVYGDGHERHLQSALMAVCEALDLPQVSDFVQGSDSLRYDFPFGCSGDEWDPDDPFYEACHCLPLALDLEDDEGKEWTETLHNANLGMLRGDPESGNGNPLHIVVMTDEGDQTYTMENIGGDECADLEGDDQCDCQLAELIRLLRSLVPELRISVIGPGQGLDAPEDERYYCNGEGSAVCAIDYLFNSVAMTNGFYHPINVPTDGDQEQCEPAELAQPLAELVLFHPSVEWYMLSTVPESNTLEVTRDDLQVPPMDDGGSCTNAELGRGGWSYDKQRRSVSLVGDCTAYGGQLVEVSYEAAGPIILM